MGLWCATLHVSDFVSYIPLLSLWDSQRLGVMQRPVSPVGRACTLVPADCPKTLYFSGHMAMMDCFAVHL